LIYEKMAVVWDTLVRLIITNQTSDIC